MDGRGRALDNVFVERLWRKVKQEDLYLKGYETAGEMMRGFAEYFQFYSIGRPHQSLGYKTPDEAYESSIGGGARIIDKFSQKSVSEGSSEATGPQQEAA